MAAPFSPSIAARMPCIASAIACTFTILSWVIRRRSIRQSGMMHLAEVLKTESIKTVSEAHELLVRCGQLGSRSGVGLAVFPGSFNPPSIMHCEIMKQVTSIPGVDTLWLDMTIHRTKKLYLESLREERVRMTELAAGSMRNTSVTTLMANMGDAGWTSIYFDVLREFAGSDSVIFWVMGSDVIEDMRYYAEKATTLLCAVDHVVVFERQIHEKQRVLEILREVTKWPECKLKNFVIFRKLGHETENVSSSNVRRILIDLHKLIPVNVLRHVINNNALLDFYQDIGPVSPNVTLSSNTTPNIGGNEGSVDEAISL
eukprot:TRINITY_DN26167_c0_g1_i1.p1 TRINITY_DN26167_c0_g1~~TRINITY_DN26167_c0_g1_i1.p1  ORF type:complete len:315 (+),score=16.86 TRINITY_DN26167_c0_g1_i1:98-1042(+)